MTTEEILLHNKRCVELLGDEGMQKICSENGYHYPSIDEMRFHSDWNWIMEVVEAIEKLEYESTKVLDEFRIESFQVVVRAWITPEHKIYNIIPCEPNTKKEAVVEAINQFLIWYKENKL